MNDFYSMILDGMCFSYSSVNSFVTCPFSFFLTYIKNEEREKSWYSDYGLLIHNCLERYFKGELEIFELSKYYEDNYALQVTSSPPPYPKGIVEKYYSSGLDFFNNFDFDKSKYNIVSIEDKIKTTYIDINLVIKPDVVLIDKETKDTILLDFKTSNPFIKDKPDEKKMNEYKKQMYLYAYFINHTTKLKINKIKLWFVRVSKWYEFDYDEGDAIKVVSWFYSTINKIKQEEEFLPADLIKNKFFCQMLCSMRSVCHYVN
jgi:hypothetical protein